MFVRTINHDPEVVVFSADDLQRETDTNVDIEVRLADGTRWAATIFTITSLRSLLAKNRCTRQRGVGEYLWCSDMIVVETLSEQSLTTLVHDLITAGRLTTYFDQLPGAPRR